MALPGTLPGSDITPLSPTAIGIRSSTCYAIGDEIFRMRREQKGRQPLDQIPGDSEHPN